MGQDSMMTICRKSGQAVRLRWTMSYVDPVMTSCRDIRLVREEYRVVVTIAKANGEDVTLAIQHPRFVEVKPYETSEKDSGHL